MEAVDPNESRQTEVLVVAWVMTGLAIFTVGVKLFARVKIVQVIGWDDFFIFFSLVSLQLSHIVIGFCLSFAIDTECNCLVICTLWGDFRIWSSHKCYCC